LHLPYFIGLKRPILHSYYNRTTGYVSDTYKKTVCDIIWDGFPISKNQFAGLVEVAEVDSTNKEMLRRLDADTPEFFAVTADEQTAGLGRLGRNWVTESGRR